MVRRRTMQRIYVFLKKNTTININIKYWMNKTTEWHNNTCIMLIRILMSILTLKKSIMTQFLKVTLYLFRPCICQFLIHKCSRLRSVASANCVLLATDINARKYSSNYCSDTHDMHVVWELYRVGSSCILLWCLVTC